MALTEVLKIVAEDRASATLARVAANAQKSFSLSEVGAQKYAKALSGYVTESVVGFARMGAASLAAFGVASAAALGAFAAAAVNAAVEYERAQGKITGQTTALVRSVDALTAAWEDAKISAGQYLSQQLGLPAGFNAVAGAIRSATNALTDGGVGGFLGALATGAERMPVIGTAVQLLGGAFKLVAGEIRSAGIEAAQFDMSARSILDMSSNIRSEQANKKFKQESGETDKGDPFSKGIASRTINRIKQDFSEKESLAKALAAKELAMEEKRDAAMLRFREKAEQIEVKKIQTQIAREEEITKFKNDQKNTQLAWLTELDTKESANAQRRIGQLGQIAGMQSATTADKNKYLRALEHESRISSDPDAAFAYTMELKKRGEELASVYANVGSQIGGVFNAIIRGGMSAEDVMLKLIGTALSLASSIFLPGAGAAASGIFGFLGSIFGFQDGGVIRAAHGMRVPGVGAGDRVPALLEPGETVVPKGGTQPGFIEEVARAAGGGGGGVTVNLSQSYLVPPDSVTAQRTYQRGLVPVLQDLHSTGRGSVTNPRFRGTARGGKRG